MRHKNQNVFDFEKKNFGGDPALTKVGITNPYVYRNLSTPELYEMAVDPVTNWTYDPNGFRANISSTGCLAASSSICTGRSPKERRIVLDDLTKDEVYWSEINMPISPKSYSMNR
jgi:phosphoenolpyruvate carboxykinase (ATP)